MIAFRAYKHWQLHGNLIGFLPNHPCSFFKGECWHCWDFLDDSSFKIMHGIPYIIDRLNGGTEWKRLEP